MRLHGINQTVKEVLEKSFYTVPRFQRPYSWDEEQVEDLWNDLIVNYFKDYFIGSIVVFSIDNYYRGVVDGQQRLMTITIMLAALRDRLNILHQDDLAKGIQNFIERRDVKNQSIFIVQQETSYPFFQKTVQTFPGISAANTTLEEQKIKAAYEFIATRVESLIGSRRKSKQVAIIEEIREKILSAQAILIQLDTEDDAYLVFEILNSRGKNLRLSDLVKNHFMRMMPNRNKMLDVAKDEWGKIQNTINDIEEIDMDTFLRHFYNSIQGSTPEHALYKKFKEMINKKNAVDQLEKLVGESVRYSKISAPHQILWKKADHDISRPLVALKIFGVSVSVPLLLTSLRCYEDSRISRKQLLRILKMLEQFHFEYTAICSKRSSGGLASLFGSVAKRLAASNNNAEVDSIILELNSRLSSIKPSKEEFVAEFKKVEYSSSNTKLARLIRYIFSRVEAERYKSVEIDWDKMSIEHFIAQNGALPARTTKKQVFAIGNLLLLSSKYNSDLGNLPPEVKLKTLKKDKVTIDPYLVANGKAWDGSKINKRSELLANSVWANTL